MEGSGRGCYCAFQRGRLRQFGGFGSGNPIAPYLAGKPFYWVDSLRETMSKTVAAKMGIKPGIRAFFINAPADALEAMELPALERHAALRDDFDYIHLFAQKQTELHEHFPVAKTHLNPTGTLWVSWPKGGQLDTDLTLTKVIKIGYDYGLVESKTLSINPIWSAIKFTHPREGKVYNNSYGTLKP